MAVANAFVLLSSSPLQPTAEATQSTQHTCISSSPALPSPSQLLSRKICTPSTTMGRSPLHKDAVVSFRSASSLLRRSQSVDDSNYTADNEEEVVKASTVEPIAEKSIVKKALRPVKDKKEPMKVEKTKAPATKATARRKSKIHFESADIGHITAVVAGRVISEPQDKKSREPAQTKIKNSKVTKVGSVNGPFGDSKLKGKAKRISKVDKEFTEASREVKETTPLMCSEPQDLCLDDAIRRRNIWTPVKDTGNGITMTNDDKTHTQAPLDQGTPAISKCIDEFANSLGDYVYAHTSASLEENCKASRNPTGEALTKRRKVEV